jgi:hypothetical protein
VFTQINRLVVLLMLMVVVTASTLVSAQGPQPQESGVAGLPALESSPEGVAASAKELRESLTAAQVEAIQAILQRHAADFDALTAELSAITSAPAAPDALTNQVYLPLTLKGAGSSQAAPGRPSGAPDAAQLAELQAIQGITKKLIALQDSVSAEVEALYTTQQQTLNQTVAEPLRQMRTALSNPSMASAQLADQASTQSATLAASPSYCYVAAQYASLATYYSYYAYVNAYAHYIYYGVYAPYGYLYSGINYSLAGLTDAANGYFDLTMIGSDFHGYVAAGVNDNYNAYLYNNAGSSTGLSSYNATGSSYAFYAYYYGYYAKLNSSYAYQNNYACYYR